MSTFKVVGIGEKKVLLLPGLPGAQDAFDVMLQFADKESFQHVVPSLEMLPRVGHYPMIEAPAAAMTAVENFVGAGKQLNT
jgi:hypothetical protein